MGLQIKKAVREQIYTKIALMAPSGGGKTYSSLRLATGMAREIEKETGKKAKILMGNTEESRGYYYADEFDYDTDDEDEEEPEDSENSEDDEDDEEPKVYKSELTFRDKLFAATAVEVVESVFEDGIDMNINYKTTDYTGVFALRCIKTGTFEYGHISMAPGMIRPVGAWSKLEMEGFIGIMKTKCPDNPFYKWYTSEDGYQKYVKEWAEIAEQ